MHEGVDGVYRIENNGQKSLQIQNNGLKKCRIENNCTLEYKE